MQDRREKASFGLFVMQFTFIMICMGLLLVFSSLLAAWLSKSIFHVDFSTILTSTTNNTINALRFSQVITMLLTFGVAAFLFPTIVREKAVSFLGIKKKPLLFDLFMATLLFIAVLPAIESLVRVNEAMKLPSYFHAVEAYMRSMEMKLASQVDLLLTMNSFSDFLLVIGVVALVPALAEEFFFRGFLQQFFQKWVKSAHVAVIITAFIFSTVHMQFFGFLPRFLLGLLLGYLFLYSQRIWTSVYFHFINNLSNILYLYIFKEYAFFNKAEHFMRESNLISIVSLGIAAAIFLFLANYYSRKYKNRNSWIKVFSTSSLPEAEIIKGKLESGEINAVIVNKRDSVYPSHGTIEVMVNKADEELAKEILARNDE